MAGRAAAGKRTAAPARGEGGGRRFLDGWPVLD
ncbi:hypothetical protein FHY02_002456 [Sphingomonas sp. BK069]|nr:hypothetical protein [Sphingomonas sp. BK069]